MSRDNKPCNDTDWSRHALVPTYAYNTTLIIFCAKCNRHWECTEFFPNKPEKEE